MLITLGSCAAIALLLTALALSAAWLSRRMRWRSAVILSLIFAAAALPPAGLSAYLGYRWVAGQPMSANQQLADGVTYQRIVMQHPRRAVAHVVEIDLTKGHHFVVTPPVQTPSGPGNHAIVTTAAVTALDADLVFNASFFKPFRDRWFMDYKPHAGEPAYPRGMTIGGAERYGEGDQAWPSLCIEDTAVRIGMVNDKTEHAVSGRSLLVRGSEAFEAHGDALQAYARTAVGLDEKRTRMWVLVVDGKQPGYSEGLTLSELTQMMKDLGATDAINLDGGGSSTLAHRDNDGRTTLLNRPCHTKIPGLERPVANHVGIRFADP